MVRIIIISLKSHTHTQILLSPVFFAVLQQGLSISAGSVRAHICVPSSHGTGRCVILGKEKSTQKHKN